MEPAAEAPKPVGLLVVLLVTVCAADQATSLKKEASARPHEIYDFDMDDPHPVDQLALETISRPVYALPDNNSSLYDGNKTFSVQINTMTVNITMVTDDEIPTQISLDVAVVSDTPDNSVDETSYYTSENFYANDTPHDQLALPSEFMVANVARLPLHNITLSANESSNYTSAGNNEHSKNNTHDQQGLPSNHTEHSVPATDLPQHNVTTSRYLSTIPYRLISQTSTKIENSEVVNNRPVSDTLKDIITTAHPDTLEPTNHFLPDLQDSFHEKRQVTPLPLFYKEQASIPLIPLRYTGLHDNIPFLIPEHIYGPPRRPEPFVTRTKSRIKGRKRVGLKRPRQRVPHRNYGNDSNSSSELSSLTELNGNSQSSVIKEQETEYPDLAYGIKALPQAQALRSNVREVSFQLTPALLRGEVDIKYNSPREVLQKFPPRHSIEETNTNKHPADPQDRSIFSRNKTLLTYPDLQEGIIADLETTKSVQGPKFSLDNFRQQVFIPEETDEESLLNYERIPQRNHIQQSTESVFTLQDYSDDEVFQFEESERDNFAAQIGTDIPHSPIPQSQLPGINSELYEGLRLPYYSLIDNSSNLTNTNESVLSKSELQLQAQNFSKDGINESKDFPFILQESLRSVDHSPLAINQDQFSQNSRGPTDFIPNQPDFHTLGQNLNEFQQFQQSLLQSQTFPDNTQFPDYYDPALFEYLDALYRAQAQGYHVPEYLYDYDYDADFINAQLGPPPPSEEFSPPPPSEEFSPPPPTGQAGIPLNLLQGLNGVLSAFPPRQSFNPAGSPQVKNTNPAKTLQGQTGNILNSGIPLHFAQLLTGQLTNLPEEQVQNPLTNIQGFKGFPSLLQQGHNGVPLPLPQIPLGNPSISKQQENKFPLDFPLGQHGKPIIPSVQDELPMGIPLDMNGLSTASPQRPDVTVLESIPTKNGDHSALQPQLGIPLHSTGGQNILLNQQGHNRNQFGVPLPPSSPIPSFFQTTSSNFPTTPRIRFTEESILSIKPQNNNPKTTNAIPVSQRPTIPITISTGQQPNLLPSTPLTATLTTQTQRSTTLLPSTQISVSQQVPTQAPQRQRSITLFPATQIPLSQLAKSQEPMKTQTSLSLSEQEEEKEISTVSGLPQNKVDGKVTASKSHDIGLKTPISLIEERPVVLVGGVTGQTVLLVEEKQAHSVITNPSTLTKNPPNEDMTKQKQNKPAHNNNVAQNNRFTVTKASAVERTSLLQNKENIGSKNIFDISPTISTLRKPGTGIASIQDDQIETPFFDSPSSHEKGNQRKITLSGNVTPVSPRIIDGSFLDTKPINDDNAFTTPFPNLRTISTPSSKVMEDLKQLFGTQEGKSRMITSAPVLDQSQELAFGSGIVVDDKILKNLEFLASNGALSNESLLKSLSSINILKNLEEAVRNSSDPSYFVFGEIGDSSASTTQQSTPNPKTSMNSLKKLMALKISDASDIPTILRNFIAAQNSFRGGRTLKDNEELQTTQEPKPARTPPNLFTSLQDMMTATKSINAHANSRPSDNRKNIKLSEMNNASANKDNMLSNSTAEYNGEFIILLSNKSSVYPKDGEFIVIIPQPTWSPFFQEVFSTPKPINRLAREGGDFSKNLNEEDTNETYSSSESKIHSTSRRGVSNTLPPEYNSSGKDELGEPLGNRNKSRRRKIISEAPADFSNEDDSRNWFISYSGDYGLREPKENDSLSKELSIAGDEWINSPKDYYDISDDTNINDTDTIFNFNRNLTEAYTAPTLSPDEKRGVTREEYYSRYIPTPQTIPQVYHNSGNNESSTAYPYTHNNYGYPYFNAPSFRSSQELGYFYQGQHPQLWYGPPTVPIAYPYFLNPTPIPYGLSGLNESQVIGITESSLVSGLLGNELGIPRQAETVIPFTTSSEAALEINNNQNQFAEPQISQYDIHFPNSTPDYDFNYDNLDIPNSSTDYYSSDTEAVEGKENHSAPTSYNDLLDLTDETDSTLSPTTGTYANPWNAHSLAKTPSIFGSTSGLTEFHNDFKVPTLESLEQITLVTPNASDVLNSGAETVGITDIPLGVLPSLTNSFPSDTSSYIKEESIAFPVYDVQETPLLQATPNSILDGEHESGFVSLEEAVEDALDTLNEEDIDAKFSVSSSGSNIGSTNLEQITNIQIPLEGKRETEPPIFTVAPEIFDSAADIQEEDDYFEPYITNNLREVQISLDDLIANAEIPFREISGINRNIGVPLPTESADFQSTSEFSTINTENLIPTAVSRFVSNDIKNSEIIQRPINDATDQQEKLTATTIGTNYLNPEVLTENPSNVNFVTPSLERSTTHQGTNNINITVPNTIHPRKQSSRTHDVLSDHSFPRDSKIVTIDLGIVPLNSLGVHNKTNITEPFSTRVNDGNNSLILTATNEEPDTMTLSKPPLKHKLDTNLPFGSNIRDQGNIDVFITSARTILNTDIIVDDKLSISQFSGGTVTNNDQEKLQRENYEDLNANNHAKKGAFNSFPSGDFGIPDDLDLSHLIGLTVDFTLPGIQIVDITPLAKAFNKNLSESENPHFPSEDIVSLPQENLGGTLISDPQVSNDQVLIISENGNNVQGLGDTFVQEPALPQNAISNNYADYFIKSSISDTDGNTGISLNGLNSNIPIQFNPQLNPNTLNNPVISEAINADSDLFSSREPIILLDSPVKLESLEDPTKISGIRLPPASHVVTSSISLGESDYIFSDDLGGKENVDFDYSFSEPNSNLGTNVGNSAAISKLKIPGRADFKTGNSRVTPALPEIIVGSKIFGRPGPHLSLSPTPTISRITETTTTTVYVPVVQSFATTPTPQRIKPVFKNTQKQDFKPSSQLGSPLASFNPSILQFQPTRNPLSNAPSQDQSDKWVWSSSRGLPLSSRPFGSSGIKQISALSSKQGNYNPTYRELPSSGTSGQIQPTGTGTNPRERWVWEPVNRDGIPADSPDEKPEGIEEWLPDDYLLSPSIVSYLYKKLDDMANDYIINDTSTETTMIPATPATTKAAALPQFYWPNTQRRRDRMFTPANSNKDSTQNQNGFFQINNIN